MKLTDFERMGGTYHQKGDYLIPNVVAPQSPQVGAWGERRRQFLLRDRKPIYTGMLLSGRLNTHLEEVNRSAVEMFSQLVEQMATQAGMVTDLYAHILDEDRKVNAQRFEAAFYANPVMRKVEREIVEQAKPQPQPQSAAVDLQQLFAQLQQNPEVLGQLAAMLKAV